MNCQKLSIGDLGKVVTGRTPPAASPEMFGDLVPFLTPSDMDGVSRYAQVERHLSIEGAESFARIALPPHSVCCVCIGATIGKICMTSQQSVSNQQINSIVVDQSRHDPRYVYYKLLTLRDALKAQASGAATPIVNKSQFSEFEIEVPGQAIQTSIASILSAYDDLIENNTQRIAVLEEMARRIYEEWFVHFRAPGSETLPHINTPLGPVPEGWEVVRLKDVTKKIGSGATPKGGKESYLTEGINLVRSLNVYDYQFEYDGLAFISDSQAEQLNNVSLEDGDVLLNITGASVARCCLLPTSLVPGRVNQHVAIVRASRDLVHPGFLLDSINERMNKQKLLAIAHGGATREALTKETIENFSIVVAPRDIMSKHAAVAEPIHLLRDVLARQNRNLRAQRDLLLPKLISGEIDVSEAPAYLEAAE